MEEDQYRTTYKQFNQVKCAFEKAILSRRCGCTQSHKFCLAEREGVSCDNPLDQQRWQVLLQNAREKSLFVFKITQFDGVLPHAKEIRVQLGSLAGLNESLGNDASEEIDDIKSLLILAEETYGKIEQIPYDNLIRAISHIQGRRRKK